MTEETKVCSKCGEEKPLRDFGKRGNKRKAECKECNNKYMKSLRNRGGIPKGPEEISPLFDPEPVGGEETIKRKQMVMLEGETQRFMKITCSCGFPMQLEYHHSYDEENDYYERTCSICSKIFKLTVTSPLPSSST